MGEMVFRKPHDVEAGGLGAFDLLGGVPVNLGQGLVLVGADIRGEVAEAHGFGFL